MIKLLAAIMIISGTFILGWLKQRELTEREEHLCRVRWETVGLKNKIEGCAAPLLDIFEESEFFAPAAERIKNGASVYEAVLPLGKDVKGFELFARGLGGATALEQIGNMEVFLAALEGEITEAKEKKEKMSRLYIGGGLMAGIAICIILM